MKQFSSTPFWVLILIGLISTPLLGQQSFPDELKTRAPENIEEVKLLEQHVQKILKEVSPATVSVSGGSGVVINDEGLILTVAHVNQRAGRRVRITFPDGTRAWGETLGNNHQVDAGLIKITSEGDFPFVEMADSSACEPGQWCMAVGFPVSFSRGEEPAIRLGRILSNRSTTIVSDCTIMGGDSGGPLFDLDGKVIGISSRVTGSLNSNVHVPVNIYKRDWDKMLAGEDFRTDRSRSGRRPRNNPNRGYLGIRGNTNDSPATIDEVVAGSAAEKAGLKVGDIIVELNDNKVDNFGAIGDTLSKMEVGDSVSLMIRRDDALTKYTIQLGKR